MASWKSILWMLSIYTILFIAVLFFVYVLARLIPGDPITILYGEIAEDSNARETLAVQLNLNKPIHIQFLTYIGNILRGKWGKSIYSGEDVLAIISRSFISSLKLAILSILSVTTICGLVLYLEYVYCLNINRMLNIVSLLFSSIPTVVWGAILMLILTELRTPIILNNILPPLIVLILIGTGNFYRLFKSAIDYGYQQPFIETYAIMGYSRDHIFLKTLRYSLPIIFSAIMHRTGLIIVGAIVIETMFRYPGMGFIFSLALTSRDYPVLIGWSIAISITLIIVNLVINVIHSLIDPRLRLSNGI